MSQADENARALEYQRAQARQVAFRRAREAGMRGNVVAYRGLFERTKAVMRSWSGADRR